MNVKFEKYAQLLLGSGVNLQKDEYLIIEAPIETADFVRELSKAAFEKGAKDVIVYYSDPYFDLIRLNYADEQLISEVKDYEKESLQYYLDKGAISILIESAYPFLYKDCKQSKNAALQTHTNDKRNVIRAMIASSGTKWLIASYPNKLWAKTLFPELPEEEAFDALCELLYDICRIDTQNDPNENWAKHLEEIAKYGNKLDEIGIDHLIFKNSIGTDLTIGLTEEARFGHGDTPRTTCANIPTEEVCTTPDKYRVNGKVVASKPLEVGGAIIENFGFTFKDGKVTDFYAEKNQDVLASLVNADEGSCYLGEVALVGYSTPISLSNKVFYTTLLDENASCHLALGKGFYRGTDREEWEKAHANFSKIHIDFMFGTKDMDIIAVDREGKQHQIFKNGDFVI